MRKVFIAIAVLLGGALVIRALLPAEQRAKLRERLSRLPEECECPCHQAEAEGEASPEKDQTKVAAA